MLENNKQTISNVENSSIQQARGDIHNTNTFILTEGKTLEDVIRSVMRSELDIVTKEAYEKFNQIIEEFRNRLADEIRKLKNPQDIVDRFKEPKYQFALHDTIKEYAQTDCKETKEDLIDLLIDGLQVDDNSTEQFVINDARHIIPKLTIASSHFLGAMLLRKIVYGNHPYILTINLEEHAKIFEHLDKITKLDIAYMQQLGCIDTMGLQFNVTIEEEMRKKYDLFFRQAPSIEKYAEFISNNPQIKDLDLVHKMDGKFGFQKVSTNLYEEELRRKGLHYYMPKIKEFISLFPLYNDEEIKNKLLSINPLWENAIHLFDDESIKGLKLSPVGAYIANRIVQKEKMHVARATLKELF